MLDQKNNKRRQRNSEGLSAIPDKLYFTIGEVSKLCDLKSHVLRYWEQEFPQLNPSKRRGNRRYYQRKDVLMIREIMSLLYEQGFTIEGARSKLNTERDQQTNDVMHFHLIQETIKNLETILTELEH
ncbi:MAG: MerR family transcriptional regulator [Gammaproteobacteria bacterium]|nr:MerR family transcriptional regulator [Gammaproteobacteria bacterium]